MGSSCTRGRELTLTDRIWSEMAAVQLRWAHCPAGAARTATTVTLPVYRYPNRQNLLFTLDFQAGGGTKPATFCERGVAVLAAAHLG